METKGSPTQVKGGCIRPSIVKTWTPHYQQRDGRTQSGHGLLSHEGNADWIRQCKWFSDGIHTTGI